MLISAYANEAAHFDGASLGPLWAAPFIALLLSIAILPLATPHFWHRHFGKVTLAWALVFLVPFAVVFGVEAARSALIHTAIAEYVPFIALLFTLYVVSGGIFIDGNIKGSPAVNTALLATGTFLASFIGTTGASVLLIRPLLRANDGRRSAVHAVVFFIFLVSNVGGALSPLGDPPLYLGFLNGVDFFWPTTHLWRHALLVSVILLVAFFVIDTVLYRREPERADQTPETHPPVKLRGFRNVVLLLAVIVTILATSTWKAGVLARLSGIELGVAEAARTMILLGIAATSLMVTPRTYREGNQFTWAPIAEVAKLFAGIFLTMVPVLAMLQAGRTGAFAPVLAQLAGDDGSPNNAMYFWLTGGLSSFLDNAPTYLVFFNAAGGDATILMRDFPVTLAAISAGAVFMGANTYIGNAPNFMVKAIAEEAGVKMPSFFGFMLWSALFLLPSFALVTLIFF